MKTKTSLPQIVTHIMTIGLLVVATCLWSGCKTTESARGETYGRGEKQGGAEAKSEKPGDTTPKLPPFKVPFDPNIPKKRVLVSSFQNAVPALSGELNVDVGLTAQLITVLSKCRNFIVLDRSTLEDLQHELVLKQAQAVTKQTAAVPGQLLGAQVVIKGVVTEFSEEVEGEAKGMKVGLGTAADIAGIFVDSKALDALALANPEIGHGKETVTGTVGLDIRLIDLNTGVVLHSIDARGEITHKNSSHVLGIAGFSAMSEKFENTVIGQATRLAIRDAVVKIFELMKDVRWQGMVAAVRPGGIVIINAGSDQNIRKGQLLNIEAEGEKITDPGTGLVLFVERQKIAEIRVERLLKNVSFAQVIMGSDVQRGDLVTLP